MFEKLRLKLIGWLGGVDRWKLINHHCENCTCPSRNVLLFYDKAFLKMLDTPLYSNLKWPKKGKKSKKGAKIKYARISR